MMIIGSSVAGRMIAVPALAGQITATNVGTIFKSQNFLVLKID